MSHDTHRPEETTDEGYGALAVAISAIAGVVAAAGAYLLVKVQGTFAENLFRVQPEVEGGGVGSDWVAGNVHPLLDAMIVIIHAADVVMGLFILAIVFVNWAAFRRLAERMRRPHEAERRPPTTDDDAPTTDDDPRGRDDDATIGGDER